VVTDGVNGFLPKSPGGWAEALIALIQDPQLRQRVGTAGRSRVEAAYSLAAVLPRYLDIWARLSSADDTAGLPTAPKC
jgi:glycosyltransferase involved in cell wall biosynthesis